jgi:hypothetical protein
MLDLPNRRAARAYRQLAERAMYDGKPLEELASPQAALEAAEAKAPFDRFALAGIGKIDPAPGAFKP